MFLLQIDNSGVDIQLYYDISQPCQAASANEH
jgi:hypothetical protein